MAVWERWVPVEGLPSKIYNSSLIDNKEGLTLTFIDEHDETEITMKFDVGVLSYSNTEEGSLIKMLSSLYNNYDERFYSEWSLFKLGDSEYLSWFLEENAGLYDTIKISHYVFLTPNDVIEVLSKYPPTIALTKRV
ncbi:hypothetical protein [Cytobacillus sp. IB215665]|uniref:hypothetical protein n=1 Tax=Cytobacillus sp. IB215665 TaxID=3097357 RepID=UPI002A0C7654|nr:hypothetical protein [Cytobacillus sp. IB215665]MDX8366031.1 hypothetical protein [Cytobacillus sp. IB215665]